MNTTSERTKLAFANIVMTIVMLGFGLTWIVAMAYIQNML